jgi:hypothetical protein
VGWTLAIGVDSARVGLVWVFATKRGLAGAMREFTVPPPFQI